MNSLNVNTGVVQCSILADGSFSGCTLLTDTTFSEPFGIAMNSANNTAYITNSNNTVSQCSINSVTGVFNACTALSDPTLNEPMGIAINSTGTTAYISNENTPSVSQCTIDSSGAFTGCVTLADSEFNFPDNVPLGITLNQAGDTAFITVNFQNVLQCPITGSGGFGTCSLQTIPTFENGGFIAFTY